MISLFYFLDGDSTGQVYEREFRTRAGLREWVSESKGIVEPCTIVDAASLRYQPKISSDNRKNLRIADYTGLYDVAMSEVVDGKEYYLMEHSFYGEDVPCLWVDEDCHVIVEDVWNGLLDLTDHLENEKYEKEVITHDAN